METRAPCLAARSLALVWPDDPLRVKVSDRVFMVWSPLPGLMNLCLSSPVLLLDDWWRFYTLLLLLWHGIHWTAVDSESAFFLARPRQIWCINFAKSAVDS